MNALSCLLFPNSIGRIETGTELAMSDLRRMRSSFYHSQWVALEHGPRHPHGGFQRLRARGRLVLQHIGGLALCRPVRPAECAARACEERLVSLESRRPAHGGSAPSPAK